MTATCVSRTVCHPTRPRTAQTTTRSLAGSEIYPIGLGAMPMSLAGRPDEAQSIRTIHAALDAGANLIDTADAYCLDESEVGHNERLIAKAIRDRRDGVLVATKGGHTRPGGDWDVDGTPAHLRAACEASLRALETDRIDLYQYHRPDPRVPYAESVGALKELQDEGKIRWIGLSNANLDQLEEALGIAEIVAVQNQLSLEFTSPLAKREVQAATDRGIAFLPWSPLGGIGNAASPGGVNPVKAAAERHGVSPQQVALAWLLSLGPTVIPIPGASRPETITDSLKAARLELSADELAAIGAAATARR
jgi:aryl-alcohol dehydrogenase-like predicted oxidoreductase